MRTQLLLEGSAALAVLTMSSLAHAQAGQAGTIDPKRSLVPTELALNDGPTVG